MPMPRQDKLIATRTTDVRIKQTLSVGISYRRITCKLLDNDMTSIDELRKTWELLAEEDALWAICTAPDKRGGKWDPAEFFASGEKEIRTVLDYLRSREVPVRQEGDALDFGCGVGRLTGALARQFVSCCGVDISSRMIETREPVQPVSRQVQLPAKHAARSGHIRRS